MGDLRQLAFAPHVGAAVTDLRDDDVASHQQEPGERGPHAGLGNVCASGLVDFLVRPVCGSAQLASQAV